MPHEPPPLSNNMLLARLTPRELRRVQAVCQFVELSQGAIVCEEGKAIEMAYFPLSNVFSSLMVENHRMVETCVTGIEGMIGSPLAVDIHMPSPTQIEQQVTGDAIAIPAAQFVKILQEIPHLKLIVTRFAQTLIFQSGLAVLCFRSHTVDRRLARWLLETVDRCGRSDIQLKQQYLAAMIGVCRSYVNQHVQALHEEEMIEHRRGRIVIRDFTKLEAKACPCYARNRRRYQEFMKLTAPKLKDGLFGEGGGELNG